MNPTIEVNRKFLRNPHVMWSNIGHDIILFYPEGCNIIELNATAALIWEKCDGNSSFDSICALLCEKFHVSRETVEKDLRDFFEKMNALNLLKGST